MKTISVKVARIYITEAEKLLKPILTYLHDDLHVRGVTVFRGISGFGQSGEMHSSTLLDLSLDLPLTIEFFDIADTVDKAMAHIHTLVKPGHIISWDAQLNCAD